MFHVNVFNVMNFLAGIRGTILSTATSTVCRTFDRAENRCHWSPSWYVINCPLTWATFLMHIWICTRIRDTRCPGRPYSWKWTTNGDDGGHYLGHSSIVLVLDVVVPVSSCLCPWSWSSRMISLVTLSLYKQLQIWIISRYI